MAKKTIKLKRYLFINNEYVANAEIYPGHLIELMTTEKVRVHATAGGNVAPMVATEDSLQGKEISEAYAAADQVQCWCPVPGEEGLLRLANGETTTIGCFLESAGDGTVQVHVADVDSSADITFIYPKQIVAVALEVVDMSDSSGADPSGLVKVRFI